MARSKTKFVVVGCFLAALIALTLSFTNAVSFIAAHPSRYVSAKHCASIIYAIAGAKETWMLDQNKTTNDIPTWSDLVGPDRYLRDTPRCPNDGIYTIGKISELPTCSFPEHNEYYRKSLPLAKASTTNATP